MSDSDFADEDQQDERTIAGKTRSEIRALEDKAKKSDENEARASAAERKLAFAEAGISLGDPKAKYFVNGYDGEVNVEAIKAAAIADGFLEAPPQAGSEDQAALDRTAEAAATGRAVPSQDQAAYDAAVADTKNEAELFAVMTKFGRTVSRL